MKVPVSLLMLTLSLTRRQLYELYDEGEEPTIRLIEDLIEQLADFERILGGHQQQIIDAQHKRNERLAARLKRVKEKLARKECEVYALTRRLREVQAEAERLTRAPHSRAERGGGRGTQARLAQLRLAALARLAGGEGAERRAPDALFAAPVGQACWGAGGA
jgi:small-conductance mechanosensitive channel